MAIPIPRRACLEFNTPPELAIRNAMQEVEKVGAHPMLTEVIIKLQEAFNLLADFNDSTIEDKKC